MTGLRQIWRTFCVKAFVMLVCFWYSSNSCGFFCYPSRCSYVLKDQHNWVWVKYLCKGASVTLSPPQPQAQGHIAAHRPHINDMLPSCSPMIDPGPCKLLQQWWTIMNLQQVPIEDIPHFITCNERIFYVQLKTYLRPYEDHSGWFLGIKTHLSHIRVAIPCEGGLRHL